MEGGPGVTHDDAKLFNEEQAKKGHPYGPSYGTLQDSPHDDLDDEPPRPPLTAWTLMLGLVLTTVSAISGVLMTACLVQLGRNVVPTLELIALCYAIQMVCLVPVVAVRWQAFRETTAEHIVWLLGSGLCASLGFLCIYQAALTLPGNVVSTMGHAGFLLLTFLFTMSFDCTFDRVYSAICVGSFAGLVMMTVSMTRSANQTGWSPVVSARSLESREGVESDQGASMEIQTATVDPSQVGTSDEEGGDQDYDYDNGEVTDPQSTLMYAYITVVMGAFLASVGCLIVHRRLHSIPLSALLFWLAVTGTVLSTLEMALFTDPTWPSSQHALPVVGFLFLFNISVLAIHTSWRHIAPTLFIMVASLTGVFYMILLHAAPSFMSVLPVMQPGALEIVGVIVVVAALVAAIVWIIKGIRSDAIKE